MIELKTDKAKWVKLNDRKWEVKHNGIVLGTIFHKPTSKLRARIGASTKARYSLYLSVPRLRKIAVEHGESPMFDTFEEAQEAFDKIYQEEFLPWLEGFLDHYGLEKCKLKIS